MKIELWSYCEDEYGFFIEDDNLKQRVYLENHTLLEGIDVSEIDTLTILYTKELIKKKNVLDNMDFLINLSRNWFSITPYFNRYVELYDCIVFNHNINKFESLIDTYSSMAEKYIESYDEDGNPVVLGEFEFLIRKELNLEEGVMINSETFKEEHLYKISESDSYLYIKNDLSTGINKGIVIDKSAAEYLKNTTFVTNMTMTTCGGESTVNVREYE